MKTRHNNDEDSHDSENSCMQLEKLGQDLNEHSCPVEDTLCGIGPFRYERLQWFARPVVYLVVSSVIALVHGLFFTYANATLSSVEKDFGLPSKLSGLTTTGNDVMQLLLSIPLPYFASRGHRPRWLAFGMCLSAVGCVVAASPHFVFDSKYESFQHFANASSLMDKDENNFSETCEAKSSEEAVTASKGAVVLFLVAQMMAGIASLLYYTVGYSYLDESVSPEKAPFYLSISGAMRLLGPVCGYSLASWALTVWREPSLSHSIVIGPSHPRWIGAWWIGYFIIGSILLGVSWVLLFLPKTMPATRKRKLKELERMATTEDPNTFAEYASSLRPESSAKWKDILPSMKRLYFNPVYRLVVVNQALFWFSFFGYTTFKSKYLEHQFRLSAAAANKYIAWLSLVAALVGWLGTGVGLSFFKPRAKTIILCMAFLSLLSALCHLGQLAVKCDHHEVVGVESVNQSNGGTSERYHCQGSCNCSTKHFAPLCANSTKTSFLNACFVACRFNISANCSLTSTEGDIASEREVVFDGLCHPDCSAFSVYLVVSVIAKMAHAASRVPVNILLLRCTEERDKDAGLGVFNAMIALGSSIPAPVIFGWIIDSSCALWDSSCDQESSCWLYQIDSFRLVVHGLPAGVLFLCLGTNLCLLKYHEKIQLYSTGNNS